MPQLWYHFQSGETKHRVLLPGEHLSPQEHVASQTTLISRRVEAISPSDGAMEQSRQVCQSSRRLCNEAYSAQQLKQQPESTATMASNSYPSNDHVRVSPPHHPANDSNGQHDQILASSHPAQAASARAPPRVAIVKKHSAASASSPSTTPRHAAIPLLLSARVHSSSPQSDIPERKLTFPIAYGLDWKHFTFHQWKPKTINERIAAPLLGDGYLCKVEHGDVYVTFANELQIRLLGFGRGIMEGKASMTLRRIDPNTQNTHQPTACSPAASWVLSNFRIQVASVKFVTYWRTYQPVAGVITQNWEHALHLTAEALNVAGHGKPTGYRESAPVGAELKAIAVRLREGGARFVLKSLGSGDHELIMPGDHVDHIFLGRLPPPPTTRSSASAHIPERLRTIRVSGFKQPQHLLLKVHQTTLERGYDRLDWVVRAAEGDASSDPVAPTHWTPVPDQGSWQALFFVNLVRACFGRPGTQLLPIIEEDKQARDTKDGELEDQDVVKLEESKRLSVSTTASSAGAKRKSKDESIEDKRTAAQRSRRRTAASMWE